MNAARKLTPFGKLVVKALTDQDMTKTELARQIQTSPAYLSFILYGYRPPGKHLPALVSTLGLTPRAVERALAV